MLDAGHGRWWGSTRKTRGGIGPRLGQALPQKITVVVVIDVLVVVGRTGVGIGRVLVLVVPIRHRLQAVRI